MHNHPTDQSAKSPPPNGAPIGGDPMEGVSRLGDKVMEMLANVERQFDQMNIAPGDGAAAPTAAAVDDEQSRFEQQKRRWQQRLHEAEGRVEELLGKVELVSRTMQGKQDALGEAMAETGRLQGENERLAKAIDERDARLAESAGKLTVAGEKLVRFSALLKEQQGPLEEGAAAKATVEQQRVQIEELTRKVAQAELAGDSDAVAKRDQRISELTEALKQSRGQTGASIDVGALESRNAALEEDNDRLSRDLAQARLGMEQAQKQLEQAVSESAVRAHADENAAERFEIERESLQCELDRATQRAEAAEQRLTQHRADLEKQVFRIGQLEERLARSGAADEPGAADPGAGGLMEHLYRRKRRLARMRQLMKRRPAPVTQAAIDDEQRTRELNELREQRTEVREATRLLARTEKKMIRKWAAQRSITTVCWLGLLAALNAAMSWYAPSVLGLDAATGGARLSPAAATEAHLAVSLPIFIGSMIGSVLLLVLVYSRLARARRLFDEELETMGTELD